MPHLHHILGPCGATPFCHRLPAYPTPLCQSMHTALVPGFRMLTQDQPRIHCYRYNQAVVIYQQLLQQQACDCWILLGVGECSPLRPHCTLLSCTAITDG